MAMGSWSAHSGIRVVPEIAFGWSHILLDFGARQHQRSGAIGLFGHKHNFVLFISMKISYICMLNMYVKYIC